MHIYSDKFIEKYMKHIVIAMVIAGIGSAVYECFK